MWALLAEGPGRAALVEVPDPVAGPRGVVVRVDAALTCGTDLKLLARGHPMVPFPARVGHEFAGTVVEAGRGSRFREGERVTSAVTAPCGVCPSCRTGRENLCDTAFEEPLFGAFATLLAVPARLVEGGVRRVPDGLPSEAAALLDPLASVVRALSRIGKVRGRTVLLAGAGPLALMFTVLLSARGARVLVRGRRPRRLAILAAHGAEVLPSEGPVLEAVRAATAGKGTDVAVDAAGDATLLPDLLSCVGRGGRLLLFSGLPGDAFLSLPSARLHYDEVDVIGSFHYRPGDADEALALLVSGSLPVSALVDDRRPLASWREAFDRHASGEGMKTALIP